VDPRLWLRDCSGPGALALAWEWMPDEARAQEPGPPPPGPEELPAEVVAYVRADPAGAFLLASRGLCERSLHAFYRAAWPLLEPSTPFVEGRALRRLCEEVEAGGDLAVNLPPGFGKSSLISVALPAWVWASRPGARIITASYSESLALRDAVRSRALLSSAWFQRRWGVQLRFDENTKGRYSNSSTGFRIATSVGGRGTGERADLIIIDDAHNVLEAESEAAREETCRWMREVVPTRVNAGGRRIIVNQRVHECDASAVALGQGFRPLILPMRFDPEVARGDWRTGLGELLFPELFPEARVAALERDLGPYAVAAQLQQRPTPRGGGLFRREWLPVVPVAPPGRRVRGWDLAGTVDGAYTVGVRMSVSGSVYYVEDVVRGRWTPGQVEKFIKLTAEGDRCLQSLPQDPGSAGLAQKAALAALLAGRSFRITPETGSKEERALPLSAQAEAGKVRLVAGPWNEAFVEEATLFPRGQHKDQVDAASRAFSELVQRRPPSGFGAPELFTPGTPPWLAGSGGYRED
jgi:predicted phage terminase large subunit-like protein